MGDRINLWLHLLGLAAYFGSTAYLVLSVLPAARRLGDAAQRQAFLTTSLRVYNPLTIAALGVQIMTGAFNLTRYKAALMGDFYSQFGRMLAWKLGLVFLLVMVATYLSFGLALRIVRHQDWSEQIEDGKLRGMERRMSSMAILALVLTAVIVWISIGPRFPG